ncbi:MAG TPA: hypothetical protein VNG33_01230 [Polyangiaceae bacterium]|nr:hypothetical protein [Polyangiaceae bacterium]
MAPAELGPPLLAVSPPPAELLPPLVAVSPPPAELLPPLLAVSPAPPELDIWPALPPALFVASSLPHATQAQAHIKSNHPRIMRDASRPTRVS